jgi:cation diffusion facilitator family transporter
MKHSHNFLGEGHEDKEWRTWAVIALCTMSMIIEIICGIAFGSLALVADGVHMGTHVIAFFITASAYSYSRFHAENPQFVFGTGKVGELASFTCAIILVVISFVIIYEGIYQLIYPIPLDFAPAFAVSFVGLTVNVLSGCLLVLPFGGGKVDGGMAHGHSHNHNEHEFLEELDIEMNQAACEHEGHDHAHGHAHGHGHGHDETFVVEVSIQS